MVLSKEQIESVKKQIFKQVEKFPDPEQRQSAKQQIEAMDAEQLEEFLIQNKLIKQKGEKGAEQEPAGCIFCNITENKIQSYKIDENKSAIAILDINPLSTGQSLIVPKQHETIEKLPSSVLSLAKKIAKRIKSKLKPKPQEVKIETSSVQGHGIITILPIYKETKLERKKASPEELQSLQSKLVAKPRAKRKKKTEYNKEDISKLPLAPIRIP